MYEYKIKDVKSDFTYARGLMRYIEANIGKNEDWSESGEFGQAVNELIASVGTSLAYRMERTTDNLTYGD